MDPENRDRLPPSSKCGGWGEGSGRSPKPDFPTSPHEENLPAAGQGGRAGGGRANLHPITGPGGSSRSPAPCPTSDGCETPRRATRGWRAHVRTAASRRDGVGSGSGPQGPGCAGSHPGPRGGATAGTHGTSDAGFAPMTLDRLAGPPSPRHAKLAATPTASGATFLPCGRTGGRRDCS